MKIAFTKQQKVATNSEARTVTFNDDRYFVLFEVPYDYQKNEVKVTSLDMLSTEVVGGHIKPKRLMKWVDEMKELTKLVPPTKDPVYLFFLPCEQGKIKLNTTDIAVLDFVLNEPDDDIMFELIKKLEAV